jgi:hypothetical protein
MPSLLSNPLVIVGLVFLAIFAVSFLPGFVASLVERRMVWPYKPEAEFRNARLTTDESDGNPYAARPAQTLTPITSYANATCRRLEAMGFRYCGAYFDRRGGLYKLRYDFWLSPDRLILAMVGGGTLATIAVSGTCLFTRLNDGHCLMTIDEPKSQDSDPSGLTVQMVVTHADLEELLSRHRERLSEEERPALTYSTGAALDEHREFRTRRVDRLIDRGLARYLDEERNAWRYTLKGAWTSVTALWFRELKRQLKEPGQDRVARQGERGYVPAKLRARPVPRVIRPLEFGCWILLMLGLFSFRFNGRAQTRAQLIFRIAVPAFALLGLLALQLIKWVLARSSLPESESALEPAAPDEWALDDS